MDLSGCITLLQSKALLQGSKYITRNYLLYITTSCFKFPFFQPTVVPSRSTETEVNSDDTTQNQAFTVRYSRQPQIHRRSWLPPSSGKLPSYLSANIKPPPYGTTDQNSHSSTIVSSVLSPNQNPAFTSPPPPYESPAHQHLPANSSYVVDTGGVYGYNYGQQNPPPSAPPPAYDSVANL